MNETVLNKLEFNKIQDMLASHAFSAEARKLCRDTVPQNDIAVIEKLQQENEDALNRIFRYGSISFSGIHDIRLAVMQTAHNFTLSATELMDTAATLETCSRIRSYGCTEDPAAASDCLSEYFSCLAPLPKVSSEIRRCIISEDEIADDASPRLKSIRRNIKLSGDRIRSELSSMINGSVKSYLMEPVITMRDNRYCIPVKAEYKTLVPGMVHDSSSTGSTLFIEPESTVRLNNDIRELELAEKQEIQEIFRILSAFVAQNSEQIIADIDILTRLDYIFARAGLAADQDAMRPHFSSDRSFCIKRARHPLIDKKNVVPIDVRLGKDFDLLIITGPNTGGKTVSLKTVGLLEIMGLSGLFIPAGDGSELGLFREIFADIGDEQSIEQSLSTFSSHMTNIVKILRTYTEDSLCLFDELGAGTDPEEGAALAMSVLNFLHVRHILTMATTHYSELKIFALNTGGAENACCEFDVETLRPTYHLLIGIPGKSNAFAISRRLGLPGYVIEEAERRMDDSDRDFEDVISKLDTARQELEKVRSEADSEKAEAARLRDELAKSREKLEKEHDRIISSARDEAKSILEDAKQTADETIRDIHKYGAAVTGEGLRRLEADRTKLRGAINRSNTPEKPMKPSGIDSKDISIGMDVEIVSSGFKGTVATLPDNKGNLVVLCGIIKYKTNCGDLVPTVIKDPLDRRKNRSTASSVITGLSHAMTISPELNIIGMTTADGIAKLDKYLDEAYMSHLGEVRIVHGKGTGALRNAVRDELKAITYVKDFRSGEYGEGDAGVTIVTFR